MTLLSSTAILFRHTLRGYERRSYPWLSHHRSQVFPFLPMPQGTSRSFTPSSTSWCPPNSERPTARSHHHHQRFPPPKHARNKHLGRRATNNHRPDRRRIPQRRQQR